jgi:hypothetical protein
LFTRFNDEFGKKELESITPDEILSFLTRLTEGNNQTTKRNRYSSLKAFFNYIRNTIDFELQNPCDTPILRKIFREKRPQQWKIIEKDLIDEIIFKTTNSRNRIMIVTDFFRGLASLKFLQSCNQNRDKTIGKAHHMGLKLAFSDLIRFFFRIFIFFFLCSLNVSPGDRYDSQHKQQA